METSIRERSSRTAPGGRPQPIAFHDGTLWLGCWDGPRLFGLDPVTWAVRHDVALPGIPYGVAAFAGALHLVIGLGEADDRYIYRFTPGQPLGEEGRVLCPDATGSHLTTDGASLYLVQQTHARMLELAPDGTSKRAIPFSTRCAGAAFKDGAFYLIVADDDFDVLQFATLDLARTGSEPTTLAPMHENARGLAFDGTAWWTSQREDNLVVSFTA